MPVGHVKDLNTIKVIHPSALHSSMKALVGPAEGWEGYVMRVVEVNEDGYTPKHSHPWPHINYMLEGNGELMIDDQTHKVFSGSFAFVPPNALHQFRNAGKGIFKFICIVPKEGHIY